MKLRCYSWHLSLVMLLMTGIARGVGPTGTAAFDLPGPQLEVRITRSGRSLPISQVPTLQPGDRIWIHPKLPAEQSVHYLLIAAFLRGVTNPPPANWFTKAETWSKQVSEEGIVLTVPSGAQQAVLFLAPETGGDFNTLRSTVRGKPGAFVRASQDLNRASLSRLRLDAYLNAVRDTTDNGPTALHDRSVLLARSLSIKIDQQCFDRPLEEQTLCLTQNADQLVMEDGQTRSMVAAITSGASSDMIGQLSTSRAAGGGAYSPYVGAVVDLARLLESFRSARYQYIPALALPKQGELNLKLNNPPSFNKPMSVLVFSLPPVEAAQVPLLRPVNSSDVFCLQKPSLVLPVDGPPLVFSTNIAHEMMLRVLRKTGPVIDLPATADPARGGFVIDTQKLQADGLNGEVKGTLHGSWGFQTLEGPSFHLRNAHAIKWTIPPADRTALIVGRDDALHLQSDDTSCVEQITVRDRYGKEVIARWKQLKLGELEVQVPLKEDSPGPVTVLVRQYGLTEPDAIQLQAYSEAGRLDEFAFNAGDREGILKGTRLDEVVGLEANGVHFFPGDLTRALDRDELRLSVREAEAVAPLAGDIVVVHVALKDGRSLDLRTTIAPPRPKVTLVSKSIEPGPGDDTIRLGNEDAVPQDRKLSFFLKAEIPAAFARNEQIEVETEDGSFRTLLSLDEGTLVLEDSQSVLAELDPRSFGRSAFGPLRFRPVQGDKKGDWQRLGTLVRIPSITEVRCPEPSSRQCMLSGSNLFMIDSIASDADFTDSVSVPLGFANSTVSIPRPKGTSLYIKLRDDPSVVSIATPPIILHGTNAETDRRRKAAKVVD